MTALEQIAINKLKSELYEALSRCNKENEGRMEYIRLHLEGNIKRSIEIVSAIESHSNTKP